MNKLLLPLFMILSLSASASNLISYENNVLVEECSDSIENLSMELEVQKKSNEVVFLNASPISEGEFLFEISLKRIMGKHLSMDSRNAILFSVSEDCRIKVEDRL